MQICIISWKSYVIRNRLPRQSANWLAMTGFFDRLKKKGRTALLFLWGLPTLRHSDLQTCFAAWRSVLQTRQCFALRGEDGLRRPLSFNSERKGKRTPAKTTFLHFLPRYDVSFVLLPTTRSRRIYQFRIAIERFPHQRRCRWPTQWKKHKRCMRRHVVMPPYERFPCTLCRAG